jgi:GAF domain-containing protein
MTLTSQRPDGPEPIVSAAVSGVPGDSPDEGVEAVLEATARALPGAQHVAVSVLERGGSLRTLASTGELPERLDQLQLAVAEGPVFEVIHDGCTIQLVEEEALRRWPEFGPRARTLGVRSVVAARMAWGGRTLGALSIYSIDDGRVPASTVELARAFAGHAAATVALARKAQQLELAMVTRQQIGQAVGVLMERYAMSSEAAFNYLRRLSQNGNVKLRDVALEFAAGHPVATSPIPGAPSCAGSVGAAGAHGEVRATGHRPVRPVLPDAE